MASHPNSHWESPKFNFNSPCQSVDWKVFYTRAINYLETLNIDVNEADDHKTGKKQLKVMFGGEDTLSSPSVTMAPSPQRVRGLPSLP